MNISQRASHENNHEAEVIDLEEARGAFRLPDFDELTKGEIESVSIRGAARIAQSVVKWEVLVPEEVKSKNTALIAHGYCAKGGAYGLMAEYMASHGTPVIQYDTPRNQNRLAGLHAKHLLHPDRLVCQSPWAVIRDIRSKDKIDIPKDKIDIIGHSQGGKTSVVNAYLHPESIDNVALIDPAGLEEHDTLSLISRLPKFFKDEILHHDAKDELSWERKFKLLAKGVAYVAMNAPRALSEGISISNADIANELRFLEGIGKICIVSPDDTLLNAENATIRAKKASDLHIELPKTEGIKLGHLGFARYPQIYGGTVLAALKHLGATKTLPDNYFSAAQPLQKAA